MPLWPRLTASVYSYTAVEGLEEALGREGGGGGEAVDGWPTQTGHRWCSLAFSNNYYVHSRQTMLHEHSSSSFMVLPVLVEVEFE